MSYAVITGRISYPGPNGGVAAYLARPTGTRPWPGLIVIQEISGLVDHIEDRARRLAAEGFLCVALDLYATAAAVPA